MEFLVVLLYFVCLVLLLLYIDFGKFERSHKVVFTAVLLFFIIYLGDALELYLNDNISIVAFSMITILYTVYGYGLLQKDHEITSRKRYCNGYLLGIFTTFSLFWILTQVCYDSSLQDQFVAVILSFMFFYIITMTIMSAFEFNFVNSKYTFLIVVIGAILLVYPVVDKSITKVVNQREKVENNNQIDEDQINEESVNYILENNYQDDQIILTSNLIEPLAMWYGVVQEPKFNYEGFKFTDEDIEYIEGIRGVESASLRTNLHGLIKNQFTFYDYDQLTTEEQNQYLEYYVEALQNYYPDDSSFVDISLDNSEAGYNHIEEAIQVVDINNPNPLSDSFVKHIYYDYSNVNILEGEWPSENNQILVPNLVVDAYSLYDNEITIDNVVGKTITNTTTNEQLKIVGVYDTADYIGDDYEMIHYAFTAGNTFVAHRMPPIFEYFSDDYLQDVDETLYEIVTNINNLYYNEDYTDAEANIIEENYISPFDYEDFNNNEIVITLSGDGAFNKVARKLSKKYPQNYFVYKNLGIENIYDMA